MFTSVSTGHPQDCGRATRSVPRLLEGSPPCYSSAMRKLTFVLGLSTMVLSATAHGADPVRKPAAPASQIEAPRSPGVGADGVRRDPKGVKGISPYVELINKGDRAYVSRDFDGAIAAYREAIQSEPQNPLGHYRAGA